MIETIPVRLVTKEEYDDALKRRLLQSSLAKGTLYTLMLELQGSSDNWAGGMTTVEFENIHKEGPGGVPLPDFVHTSLFRDADYKVIGKRDGVMHDDFVILGDALELSPPHSGSLKQGFVLPHDDGVDWTDLLAVQTLDLASSAR
jgi:hypothetical protein